LNVGGPARHVLGLDGVLRARGYDPLVVFGSTDAHEGSLEDLVTAGSRRAVKIADLRRPPSPVRDVRALWRLARLVHRERPDVVHTHTAKAGTLGRLAATAYNLTRGRGRPCLVVHTFHGHVFDGYFGPLGSAAVRLTEGAMARLTDCVIAVSDRQRAEIVDRYRTAPAAKVETIEIGTDLDPLLTLGEETSLRAELGFAPSDVVFGFVGRFVPIKNVSMLVRAFAGAAASAPRARLMLVGDGELRDDAERLVSGFGLAGRVRFTGWRRDIKAIYGALDVGVLASRSEGTPLALIEAMAAGKPVIATRVGGVADVVADGRTGLLVEDDDEAGLAAAMTRLAEDPGLRCRMGQEARRQIASRFALEPLTTRLIALYERKLSERRGLPPAS
jgi:glycosyltransferase involved in cell wall biosynthesis